jgi:PPM family protein phosphatase
MVGDLVKMRVISPDKVRTHQQRSVLNKCLGIELFIQPDVTKIALKPNDIIILCSDGVWSVIEDHEFAELSAASSDVGNLARRTLDLALERDTDDNVSVVAIHAERLANLPAAIPAQRGWGIPQLFRGRSVDKS